jgi:hypothetical protein
MVSGSAYTDLQEIAVQPNHSFTHASFNDSGTLLYGWAFGNPSDCLYIWRINEVSQEVIFPAESEGYYPSVCVIYKCCRRKLTSYKKRHGKPDATLIPYNTHLGCIIRTEDDTFFPAQIRSTQRGSLDELPKQILARPGAVCACMYGDHSLFILEKGYIHTRLWEHRIVGGATHIIERAAKLPVAEWKSFAAKTQAIRVIPQPGTNDVAVVLCTLDGKVMVLPVECMKAGRGEMQDLNGPSMKMYTAVQARPSPRNIETPNFSQGTDVRGAVIVETSELASLTGVALAGSSERVSEQMHHTSFESQSVHGMVLQDSNDQNWLQKRERLSITTAARSDTPSDYKSTISNDEDISSTSASRVRSTTEIDVVKSLGQILGGWSELRPHHEAALSCLGPHRFLRNYHRVIKSYALSLRKYSAVRAGVKLATTRLLQSRQNREDIAKGVLEALSSDKENRVDAHAYEGSDRADINDLSDDASEAESMSDIQDDFDSSLLTVIDEANEFLRCHVRVFELELRLLVLPLSLRDILESVPKKHIHIAHHNDLSFVNKVKAFVEDNTSVEWDWWPLRPRIHDLPAGEQRLEWHVSTRLWS